MPMAEGTRAERSQIYLSDLIEGFIGYASERGIESFPPISIIWHRVVYKLQREYKHSLPRLPLINFDFDGPHPKSPELVESLSGMLLSDMMMWRFGDNRLIVVDGCQPVFEEKKTQVIDGGGQEILDIMLDLARHEPGFFT